MRLFSAIIPVLTAAIALSAGDIEAASGATFTLIKSLGGPAAIGAIKGKTLYGTLTYGGSGNGSLFSLTLSGSFVDLHDFDAGADGSYPDAQLAIGPNHEIFGATPSGGPYSGGTLFTYGPAGFFVPHAFGSGTDGDGPLQGPVMGTGNAMFGTTSGGAIDTNGNFFKYTAGGSYVVLHDFMSKAADGHCPFSGVAPVRGGPVYGTTVGRGFGGNPTGAIWKFSGHKLKTIYVFGNGNDGEWPDQAPVTDSGGNLYGTTHILNGNDFAGAIWKMTAAGTFSVLHDLTSATDGFAPNSPLMLNTDGYLYGTTASGGLHGYGTVFRISPAGQFALVYAFTGGTDGATPSGSLVHNQAGAIFGATSSGTVFEITN